MGLTVRDVLDLPAVARGRPRVRAGLDSLDTDVRWVHVSELVNVAGTLSGGELVLSVGVVLGAADTDVVAYLDSLRASGAVALGVELGRHVEALPDALVQAARTHGFPLIELQAPVRFVEITEAVHGRLLNAQYEQLSFSHRVHRVLDPLGIEGASTDEILRRCTDLMGLPVVLEDLAHRVIDFAGEGSTEDVLREWSRRSRQVPGGTTTTRGGPERWISSPVGPRKRRWGRLVVPTRIDLFDVERVELVLERTAETLTITHLMADAAEGIEGVASARLLQDVLRGHAADDVAIRARAHALGFSPSGPIAVVLARGTGRDTDSDAELVTGVARAARVVQRSALVGRVRPQLVAVLFDDAPDLPEQLLEHLDDGLVAVLAAGPSAAGWRDLPASPIEAEHVCAAVGADQRGTGTLVVRSRDLGIRSLLWQIRDDSRIHAFIESRLGPVLALPARRRDDALTVLETYLSRNGVMAAVAEALHLSRTAAYSRIRTVENLLHTTLADAEERTGLHVALLAYQQENRRR